MNIQVEVAIIALIGALSAAILAAWLTRRLKVSEFRQAWINELRADIAEYLGATQEFFSAYKEAQDKDKLFELSNKASVILFRIKMRFNPYKNKFKDEDDEFLATLESIRHPFNSTALRAEFDWATNSERALVQARKILKREWEVTKAFF